MASSGDRRKRKRVAVHWAVRLSRQPGTPPAESVTENLSSEGFYCIIRERFKPGERLQYVMDIPGENVGSSEPFLILQGHVTVMRVEYLEGGLGLGCHIEDYAVSTGSPPPPM